jgi:protein-L-isoaspartate(D-aspartate) O-methyltransferase
MCLLLACCQGQSQNGTDYRNKREMMVVQQIEARGINDARVLNAMRKVERHLFVPVELAANAYGDYPLPIGWDQTISQPYIVAFMTEALGLRAHSRVLEIGTGSGYQAAILAEICDSVFTVEIIPGLAEKSRKLLAVLGYKNIMVRTGDGYQGWAEHAPYQGIIVTCSPTHVPEPLTDQLAEGGKMIIPVGIRNNQELVVLVKKNGILTQKDVLPVRFVPMVNTNQQEY